MDWDWNQVRAELLRRGLTLAEVGRRNGLSADLVRKVRILPLHRPQDAIADAIGVNPSSIWPSRYDPNGKPVRRRDWLSAQAETAA